MKKIVYTFGLLLTVLLLAWPVGAFPPTPPAPAATESVSGTVELATDAETVTGTATDKVTTPANITAKMAAPGTIGGTTPAAATFTTVTVNTSETIGTCLLTPSASLLTQTVCGLSVPNLTLAGYLSATNSLGAEKITNGAMGAATGWTVGADWSIAAGLATKAAGGASTLSQASGDMVSVLVAGEVYLLTYTLDTTVTTGGLTPSAGGWTGTNQTADGTYREIFRASSTAALTFTPGNAALTATLDNVSLKRVAVQAADQVALWVDDEGGTAGKGTLYVRGENGTVVGIGGSGLTFGSLDGLGTISVPAAATVLLGQDSATPIDQTIRAPNVSAGTSNVQGADITLDMGVGRGTGRSGDYIVRTHAAGASGDTAGTLAGTLFASRGEVGVGALPDGTALIHAQGSAAGFANAIKVENTSAATETNFAIFLMKVQSGELGQFFLSGSTNNFATSTYGTSRLTFYADGTGGMQFLSANATAGNNLIAFKHGLVGSEVTSLSLLGTGEAQINADSLIVNKRTRVTAAQINAGYTLLAAVAGRKYRVIDATVIAVGGACAAVTSVDIKATQGAGAVTLLSYAQANLTQSTILKPNSTGVTALADGATFTQNDANTAITVIKAGADVTTCTNVDVILTYALES